MSTNLDEARYEMDFVSAQEVLSENFTLEVLEALNVCVRGVSRAVAEDVYAGKAKDDTAMDCTCRPDGHKRICDCDFGPRPATSPTDTGAGEPRGCPTPGACSAATRIADLEWRLAEAIKIANVYMVVGSPAAKAIATLFLAALDAGEGK